MHLTCEMLPLYLEKVKNFILTVSCLQQLQLQVDRFLEHEIWFIF